MRRASRAVRSTSFVRIPCFRDEPGAETAESLLVAAGKKDSPLHMTDVSYAAVKYSIVKRDGAQAWGEAANILQGLPIEFHSTTRLNDVFPLRAQPQPADLLHPGAVETAHEVGCAGIGEVEQAGREGVGGQLCPACQVGGRFDDHRLPRSAGQVEPELSLPEAG